MPHGWQTSTRSRLLIGVAVVVALSAGAYGLDTVGQPRASGHDKPVTAAKTWPAPPDDESSEPLGAPARVPAGHGGYTFMHELPNGKPVTYDPCRPIHYVLSTGAPTYARPLVATAMRIVSAATGLQFRYDGTTTERPVPQRKPYQPGRYGDRWAPVLIAWATATQVRRLKGDVAGLGGSIEVVPPGRLGDALHYVTGQVVFDRTAFARIRSRPEGLLLSRDVVLHELGHLVGLGHVKDPSQIMYPKASWAIWHYGDGDRRGLAKLGAGKCYPAG